MTSSLVRRPSLPVPLMRVGSTPCSSTRRRTAGESVSAAEALSSCAGSAVLAGAGAGAEAAAGRSEEHTSELQSLMRISYAVFCLKKKNFFFFSPFFSFLFFTFFLFFLFFFFYFFLSFFFFSFFFF